MLLDQRAREGHSQVSTAAGCALHWTIVTPPASISDLRQRLATERYVADTGLAVSVFLALRLKRPLFIEGEAGVGKTALAAAMAAALDTDLILSLIHI